MEPIAEYSFEGMTSKLKPYTGPLYKARPFLKWLMIAYLVVLLGISTLILKEMTVWEFLRMSILPLGLLVWLIRTRARREEIREPIELILYPTHFTLVKPQTPVKERGREIPLRDVFSMNYNEVTNLRHDLGMELVTVMGRLHIEYFDYAGEARPGVAPVREKTVNGAAAFWYTTYMDPKLNEEILERLSQCTGIEVYRFGGRRSGNDHQDRKDG